MFKFKIERQQKEKKDCCMKIEFTVPLPKYRHYWRKIRIKQFIRFQRNSSKHFFSYYYPMSEK